MQEVGIDSGKMTGQCAAWAQYNSFSILKIDQRFFSGIA
jgi:hypothetical protein